MDKGRLLVPYFRAVDYIWLNTKNIRTKRPSQKLDDKWFGPYPITAHISTYTYHLNLPASMRIHNVFLISLSNHASDDPLLGQNLQPPPSVVVDGEQEWQVEELEVLDTKFIWSCLQYLFKWMGYKEATWEPTEAVNRL